MTVKYWVIVNTFYYTLCTIYQYFLFPDIGMQHNFFIQQLRFILKSRHVIILIPSCYFIIVVCKYYIYWPLSFNLGELATWDFLSHSYFSLSQRVVYDLFSSWRKECKTREEALVQIQCSLGERWGKMFCFKKGNSKCFSHSEIRRNIYFHKNWGFFSQRVFTNHRIL